jgi:predicted DNA-binding protein
MKNTASYTSTLPSELMIQLNEFSEKLKIPKNKLIEASLKKYFEELKRREFSEGFKRAAQDPDMQKMAEEGLADYVKMLDNL